MLRRGRVMGRRATIECPECGTAMERSARSDVEVDCCEACGGVWFDKGEVDAFLERSSKPRLPVEDVMLRTANRGSPGRQCPACGREELRPGAAYELGFIRCHGCHGLFFSGTALRKLREGWLEGKPSEIRMPRGSSGPWRDLVELVIHVLLDEVLDWAVYRGVRR